MIKRCHKCSIEKPITNFKKFTYDKSKRGNVCRRCNRNLAPKEYNSRNTLSKEQRKLNQQNSYYIRKYGISFERYVELLNSQNGVCKICFQPETSKHKNGTLKSLSVDHCHQTQEIRGLLCDACNRGLGYFKDNINNIKNAAKYLKTKKASRL